MAAESPKPARTPAPSQRRGSSKLTIAGRLMALVGVPVLVITSIFAGGLYVGATRAYRVRTLEARFLGIEPPDGMQTPGSESPPDGADVETTKAPSGETEAAPSGETETEPTDPTEPKDPTTDPTEPKDPTGDPTKPDKPAGPAATSLDGVAVVSAAPVGDELRARFDEPLTVRVKVVVDPALAVTRDDWLAYVAGMLGAARSSFDALAGVEFRLQGVVLWDVAADADEAALLADLRARERDGADVILGLVARAAPSADERSSWLGDQNGDHALIYADLGRRDRYYRNTLRALAGLFGAEPTREPAATELGSFMSPAPDKPGAAPTLDPENRGKVIINKRRPFADSRGAEAPDPDPEGEGEEN